MLSSKYLSIFGIYNFILFIFFSISVNSIESLYFINLFSYAILHIIIVYLGFYYYRKFLYLSYFVCGLGLDLLLLNNQIGTHLFLFMILLPVVNISKKYLNELNSRIVYWIILILACIIISLEMLISHIFFYYDFNYIELLKLIFILLVSAYPLLFLFSKIDNIK